MLSCNSCRQYFNEVKAEDLDNNDKDFIRLWTKHRILDIHEGEAIPEKYKSVLTCFKEQSLLQELKEENDKRLNEPKPMKRIGIVSLTSEKIHSMLGIPSEVNIINAEWNLRKDSFDIVVTGEDDRLKGVPEGYKIPVVEFKDMILLDPIFLSNQLSYVFDLIFSMHTIYIDKRI